MTTESPSVWSRLVTAVVTFVSGIAGRTCRSAPSVEKPSSENSTKSIQSADSNEITRVKVEPLSFTEADLAQAYAQAVVRADWEKEIHVVSNVLLRNRQRYENVERGAHIPWALVGCIHALESSFRFDRHLHNGDSLAARTVHEPKGRPVEGHPPFTWEQSAIDAFSKVWRPKEWTLGSSLHFLEMYNGLGYRKYGIFSPYVWSATTVYTAGKFVADGSFNPKAVSDQFGATALLKELDKLKIKWV